MSYATVANMIERFGQAEMIRLTTPDGEDMVAVHHEPAERALAESSALIDGYLRKRYRVPLDIAPHEISRACCILARYDISTGEQKQPNEQVTKDRAETISWLGKIARGEVLLDLAEVDIGDESFATTASRQATYRGDSCGDSCGDAEGAFWR